MIRVLSHVHQPFRDLKVDVGGDMLPLRQGRIGDLESVGMYGG